MAKHKLELADPTGDVLRGVGIGALVGLGLYLVGRLIAGTADEQQAKRAARDMDAIRRRARPGVESTRRLAQGGRRR
jgi:hypothetical protein